MGIADELLSLSAALIFLDQEHCTQAALRRSVSTAYYAVFHLLISDAAQRWEGTTADRGGLERSFSHGGMKSVSLEFAHNRWKDSRGTKPRQPQSLRDVAAAFVDLQTGRHVADYDNHREWTQTEAADMIGKANGIFEKWQTIRTAPEAGTYLLAMLLGKQR